MEKGKVFTGARARFLINGIKIGYATNCSGTEEIMYEPVDALDNIETEEYVPVGYRVSFSAGRIRLVGNTLKQEGFFPKTGKTPEEHLDNILKQGDMVCSIEDSKTKKVLMTLQQVKVASQNFSVQARGMTATDVQFVAVRMKDESEV